MRIRPTIGMVILYLMGGAFTLLNAQQSEPASKEQIQTLLKITAADQMMEQMLNGLSAEMNKMLEPLFANLPADQRPIARQLQEDFWIKFTESAMNDRAVLVEEIAKVYEKHLTAEEVKASIEFYQTPPGQSLMKKMPTVTVESFQVGRAWGERLGGVVMRQLLEELIKKFPSLAPPQR